MTDNLRQHFLKTSLREVQIENPSTIRALLYERKERNGQIVKIPYRCLLVDVDGIPYKIIKQEGTLATCQEITAQDLTDLMEQL